MGGALRRRLDVDAGAPRFSRDPRCTTQPSSSPFAHPPHPQTQTKHSVASPKLVTEEAPEAYKDVSAVVDACHVAGISKRAVKLRPIGVVKG